MPLSRLRIRRPLLGSLTKSADRPEVQTGTYVPRSQDRYNREDPAYTVECVLHEAYADCELDTIAHGHHCLTEFLLCSLY
jgi:hypothetical protein